MRFGGVPDRLSIMTPASQSGQRGPQPHVQSSGMLRPSPGNRCTSAVDQQAMHQRHDGGSRRGSSPVPAAAGITCPSYLSVGRASVPAVRKIRLYMFAVRDKLPEQTFRYSFTDKRYLCTLLQLESKPPTIPI
jgi:hypothetical protein